MSRRRFLLAAGIGLGAMAGVAAGVGGYTVFVEPHWLKVIHADMPIADLPSELDGKRLLHISDLHIGSKVDGDYLARTLRMAADIQPDMIAITGDTLDDGHQRWHGLAASILGNLPTAPLGTFAVLGNHDYGSGWRDIQRADALEKLFTELGIVTLRNQRAEVQGLQILGFDDYWTPKFDGEAAIAQLDMARPAISLCHNPDVCDLNIWGNYRGWVLSGHTHGGQCKPPFLPPPLLPVRNRRYTRGAFEISSGHNLFISAGVGYIRQVRFNVRPDMVLFRLSSGVV